jgi:hypothetical protein
MLVIVVVMLFFSFSSVWGLFFKVPPKEKNVGATKQANAGAARCSWLLMVNDLRVDFLVLKVEVPPLWM